MIDAEPASVTSIYTGYVMILAAIPAVCGEIGTALRMAVVRYLGALVGVYVLALIIDALAPTFGGQKDQLRALKVAAYLGDRQLGRRRRRARPRAHHSGTARSFAASDALAG